MEPKEVYKIKKGVEKVTITHETKKLLDQQKPTVISITGNIDSVVKWLEKRCLATNYPVFESLNENMVSQLISHVLINREEMSVMLVFNETDPLNKSTVTGKLLMHPDFTKWAINAGTEFDSKTLSEFIKMNRSCFESKSDAMKLSAELSQLRVKVDKEVEKSNDNRGNVKQMLAQQVIEMNIPKTFKMKVPIFKGIEPVVFEVEIYVNPNNFNVSLVSPEANDFIQQIRDNVINEQKETITRLCPELVIIEQ